jgi:hypothetical protein
MAANTTLGLPGRRDRWRRSGRQHVEHLRPRLAAVGGAVYAALRAGSERVAQCGHQHHLRDCAGRPEPLGCGASRVIRDSSRSCRRRWSGRLHRHKKCCRAGSLARCPRRRCWYRTARRRCCRLTKRWPPYRTAGSSARRRRRSSRRLRQPAEIVGLRIARNSRNGQHPAPAERSDQAVLHRLLTLAGRAERPAQRE